MAGLSAATVLLLAAISLVTTLGYFREAKLHDQTESARADLEKSYEQLKLEEQRSSGFQTEVRELEESAAEITAVVEDLSRRRDQLNKSLAQGERQLAGNEEQLFATAMELAREARRNGQIELADYYLRQCPARLRNADWNLLKQQCLPTSVSFDGRGCVAVSHDGKQIAGGAEDCAVKVWDIASQQALHTLRGHTESVQAVAFSPDGKLLASVGGRELMLWNLEDGTLADALEGHEHPLNDVAFSPDGRRLASASRTGEVIVWDVAAGTSVRAFAGGSLVAFNHDGRLLATGHHQRWKWRGDSIAVRVWDLSLPNDAANGPVLTIKSAGNCLPAFHPHTNQLAVGQNGYRHIELWDVESKRMIKRLPHDSLADSIAFSRDGNRLAYAGNRDSSALGGENFRVVIWNLNTGEQERTLPWFRNPVRSQVLFDDGSQLATATSRSIKLWKLSPQHDPTAAILADIRQLDVGPLDWPQWGGSRARVNTPHGQNIPADWDIGDGLPNRHVWSPESKPNVENPAWSLKPRAPANSRNVKWAAQLGSQTYGNPVVANGRIFVGTNNSAGYLKRYPPQTDLGVLLCFEEETGRFLWQDSNEKLPTGRIHDWPDQGVCSTPLVDGNRLWYVSNRGEVVCLDTEGFYDGEDDGPEQGSWSQLFDVVTHVHTTLGDSLSRNVWQTEFQEHKVNLPRSHGIKRVDKTWVVVEYFRVGGRQQSVDRFRIRRDGELLRVFEIPGEGQVERKLFSIVDLLLPGLGTADIVNDLRGHFAKLGIQLPERVDIGVDDSGETWSFTIDLERAATDFRLRRWKNRLLVERRLTPADTQEADVVWRFDMMKELGVLQHNMANCSMLTVGGMLFVCTSNGLDESHVTLPAPDAPSFLAMDRDTGKVLWTDNSPGKNILHAQWASPSYGVFDGQPQVIFPGGDGWVYSFDPRGDGKGKSKLLWKFDGNPKDSKWILGGHRGTRNNIIAFPAIYDGLVYITMGQDPEHGEDVGHLWCINPAGRTGGIDVSPELVVDLQGKPVPHRRLQALDVSQGERAIPNPDSAVVWHYSQRDRNADGKIDFEEEFHRSISIPVIKDDVLYTADFSGLFHCLNAKTGEVYWTHDMLAQCWGSALLVDGKVFISDEDGDILVFRHVPDPKTAMQRIDTKHDPVEYVPLNGRKTFEIINEFNIGNSVYMTPIVANNVLYIATKNALYAIQETYGSSGSVMDEDRKREQE